MYCYKCDRENVRYLVEPMDMCYPCLKGMATEWQERAEMRDSNGMWAEARTAALIAANYYANLHTFKMAIEMQENSR